MSLLELSIDDLRCIEHAELVLHPGQNLVWGGNGSGKTSLLEAIFLLGRGRSFRTRNSERLIRYGRERLVVFGRASSNIRDAEGRAGGREESGADGLPGGSPSTHAAALRVGNRQSAYEAPEPISGAPGESGRSALAQSMLTGRAVVRAMGGRTQANPEDGSAQVAGGGVAGRSDPGALSPTRPGAVERGRAVGPGALTSAGSHGQRRTVPVHSLGLQVSRTEGTVARINGAAAKSLTELTQVFAVQVIDPGIHKLLEEGGHRRRRWLDWGVFHVEQQFGDWWVRYARVVKQRNAALRTQPAQAEVWDPELVRLGELIAAARGRFVEGLLPFWREAVIAVSGLEPELHYFKGWAQDVSLADALRNSRGRDQTRGITHPGPHRGDLILRLNGRPAREVLSRGQQKLVAVAMTLAQLNLLQVATQTTPTLLLDDPAAELDEDHLKRFIEQVIRLRCQLVLTSLHPESQLFGTPDRVFHVEQGRVQPV